MSYLCTACGNKTRFDVFENKRVRAFQHFSLGGDMKVEEEEILELTVERVVCRWCGSSDVASDEATTAAEGQG